MGTTLVAVVVREGRFWMANVGDSRAYRLRDRSLAQLSRDHSLVQTRVEAGLITPEEARHQPDLNVLTRAVGTQGTVEPEVREGDAAPGDLFLLTSDGVHGVLSVEDILQAAAGTHPQGTAQRLVAAALRRGSTDNATAAVLQVLEDPSKDAAEDQEPTLDSILRGPRPGGPRNAGGPPWIWLTILGALAGSFGALLWHVLRGGPSSSP